MKLERDEKKKEKKTSVLLNTEVAHSSSDYIQVRGYNYAGFVNHNDSDCGIVKQRSARFRVKEPNTYFLFEVSNSRSLRKCPLHIYEF